ncbi:MAG: AI-2E family transporter, partial [Phycisphaerae bacterium]|nr:AI-2E family transporter [Phycisphaerae bacterium]
FFRDRVLIALIMAGLFCIGWSPLLADVPYFLMLGLAAGLLSIIPYASAVAWPTVVGLKYLAVTSGVDAAGFDMWAVVVWPSVVYIVVQAIEGWILTPFIQGKSMEMSVVTILIVVFVGGAVGGMYGLLLCIPVAACLKILLQEMMLPQLKHWSAEH